jgi:hypothetical protein
MSVFMMLPIKGDPKRMQEVVAAHPEIPELMAEAGVTSRPEITFWHPVDTPDSF